MRGRCTEIDNRPYFSLPVDNAAFQLRRSLVQVASPLPASASAGGASAGRGEKKPEGQQ